MGDAHQRRHDVKTFQHLGHRDIVKRTTAVTRFRQLCCLGLGGEVVMPSLLSAMHELVLSETNGFHWADHRGELAGFLPEYVVPEVVGALVDDFEGLVAQALSVSFRQTMRTGKSVGNLLPGFTREFYRTRLFNEIYRPYNLHHVLDGVLRDGFGRGLGAVTLGRSANQPAFGEQDMFMLARLLPYMAHALQDASRLGAQDYVDAGECGLVILDSAGRLAHLSHRARELLFWATDSGRPHQGTANAAPRLPEALIQISKSLQRIFANRAATPPAIYHQNAKGRFAFRAHWLDPVRADAGAYIGVTVQYQEPIDLARTRKMQQLGLSDGQQKVCMLLAETASLDVVAQRFGVTKTTVKDHVKKIYAKAGVHSRDELLRMLS